MQEMEEKERNQKQMYDKLFRAFDEKSSSRNGTNSKEPLLENGLNSTSGSWFGKNAVEDMQK